MNDTIRTKKRTKITISIVSVEICGVVLWVAVIANVVGQAQMVAVNPALLAV